MLPSIEEWLSASWADYKRRWGTIMAVAAVTGIATAAAVFAPLVPAGLASAFGAGSAWLIWLAATSVALLLGLCLSAWAQAALGVSSMSDAGVADSLGKGWKEMIPFAWVLTVVVLAICGGFLFLILPGFILIALLGFAPFYQLDGEARGMAALELSWGRVQPRLGAVLGRLIIAWLVATIPGWIPYIGWLIGPLWAPIAVVAAARLAADLKRIEPAPAAPAFVRPVTLSLSAVFLIALCAGSYGATRALLGYYHAFSTGELSFKAPDAETMESLLAVAKGEGNNEDNKRVLKYAVNFSTPGAAALTPISTDTLPSPPAEPR